MPQIPQQAPLTDRRDAVPAATAQGPVVRVLGTLPATWLPIAQALRQALQAAGATVASTSDPNSAALKGSGIVPTDYVVALIDSPARVLAQWIATGESGSAFQVLEAWRDSATDLLKLVHRSAGRCLLIDVAEANAAPSGVMQALADWHAPLRAMRLEFDAASPPDVLCMALARHLCSSDAASAELFDELHAASVVIGDFATAPAAEHMALNGAVERYRALLAAERRCAGLESHGNPPHGALKASAS